MFKNITYKKIYDCKHLSHSFINNFGKPEIVQTPKMAFGSELHEYLLNKNSDKTYSKRAIETILNFKEKLVKEHSINIDNTLVFSDAETPLYAELYSEEDSENIIPFKAIPDLFYKPIGGVIFEFKFVEKYNKKATEFFKYDKQVQTYMSLTNAKKGILISFDYTANKVYTENIKMPENFNSYLADIYRKFVNLYY